MSAAASTEILSNGNSRLPIEGLFDRLASGPLDRTFEAYGNFVEVDPVNMRGEPLLPPGGVSFFGNFHTYSHVFNIHTTDAGLIERLTAAIRANQQRADYLAQPDETERKRQEEAARLERDRVRDEERERRLQAELKSIQRRKAA